MMTIDVPCEPIAWDFFFGFQIKCNKKKLYILRRRHSFTMQNQIKIREQKKK